MGIIFSPYITFLDRQILQTAATQELIDTKRKRIEEINTELQNVTQVPRLFDVELADDGLVGVAVGDNGAVVTTSDGGFSWVLRNSEVDASLYGVALSQDGTSGIAVGWNGVILTSDNGGVNWTKRKSGLDIALNNVALSEDGVLGVAVGRDGIILTSDNAGVNWTRRESSLDVDLNDVALSADGTSGVIVGDDRTVLTIDFNQDGFTVDKKNVPPASRQQSMDLAAVALAPNGDFAIAVGFDGTTTILTAGRGGNKWNRWTGDSTGVAALKGIALTAAGRGISVGFGDAVLSTTDRGADWRVRRVDTEGQSIDRIRNVRQERVILWGVALAADGRTGVAVGEIDRELELLPSRAGLGIIFETNDGGATWTNYEESLRNEKTSLLQQVLDLEAGGTGRVSRELLEPLRKPVDEFMTTAPLRLALLVLVLVLIQVFVGLSRYNTRLAGFYFSRADALLVLKKEANRTALETADRLVKMFSPDQVDFGRSPKAIAQQAVDVARDLHARHSQTGRT